MLPNVKQKTIKPIIEAMVVKGTMIYTDEYSIYARLPMWGYQHKTFCHSRGEYARDEDGDGFHEVHVNTMEILCCPSMEKVAVDHRSRAGEHAGPSAPVKPRAPGRAPPVGQGLDWPLLGPARAQHAIDGKS